MSYTENLYINLLIRDCGGYCDFRDIILLENCHAKNHSEIKNRMRERISRRRQKGYRHIT